MSIPEFEFHSFVNKFYQLWNSGVSAHLGIHCRAGEALVDLHAKLGRPHHQHQGSHHPPTPTRVSPSRYRRRIRRATARDVRAKESNVMEENTAEKVVEETEEDVENTTEKVVIKTVAVEASNTANGTNLKYVNAEKASDNVKDDSDEKNVEKVGDLSCNLPQLCVLDPCVVRPLPQLSAETFEDEDKLELKETDEGFIGPRLPRMLSDEEVKAMFDRLLGDKYK